tara:strand:+ start:31394 stop:31645 length:252 start_codon:yes stop_codon:yes gene_type:complete
MFMNKIFFLVTLIAIPMTSHAYIDPGTGSFMLQIIFASCIGAMFTIKMYFRKIKEKFSTLFSRHSPTNDDSDDEINQNSLDKN